MENGSTFFIVDSKALPDVFEKVVLAKRLLAQNKAASCSEAARMVGISRSAYYKYKDRVFLYDNKLDGSIATYYLSLCDSPGVLSSVISQMYRSGANILTVNQNIPVDEVAPVVITFRTGEMTIPEPELRKILSSADGVMEIKIMSGR